jgi:signal transduction histidine kinase
MKVENPFRPESPYLAVERARRAQLVRSVTRMGIFVALSGVIILVALLVLAFSPEFAFVTILSALIIPVGLWSRHLAKRDFVDAAAWIYLGYILVVLIAAALVVPGMGALLVPGGFLLVLASDLFLPWPQPMAMAGLTAAAYVLSVLLRARGVVSGDSYGSPVQILVTAFTFLAFLMMAFLIRMITGSMRQALDDATFDVREANRRLSQASEMKSQFTARTSHELRTPLSSIIAFTDLALRDSYGPLSPKLRDALTYVFNSSRHLKDIINDLLDLSKIEAGQLQMVDEAVSLPKLVEAVVGVAAPMAAEKGLKWSISVSPDMPHEFWGDSSRLEQILLNLSGNAVKYTEKGSVAMSIDRLGSDRWRVEFRDTGQGIPEDHFESIFEAYRQLNGTASPSKVKGTGLGLAITRHLVRLMGGTIRLESTLGKGSTFTVELPLRTAPTSA